MNQSCRGITSFRGLPDRRGHDGIEQVQTKFVAHAFREIAGPGVYGKIRQSC
jgi:hypothetical protein